MVRVRLVNRVEEDVRNIWRPSRRQRHPVDLGVLLVDLLHRPYESVHVECMISLTQDILQTARKIPMPEVADNVCAVREVLLKVSSPIVRIVPHLQVRLRQKPTLLVVIVHILSS